MNANTIRSLVLAAIAAAPLLPAQAALPEEAWWRQERGSMIVDGTAVPVRTTLGMHIDGQRFCGIAAVSAGEENVWGLRGQVVDGRLVQDTRVAVRGPAAASVDAAAAAAMTDYYVLPNSLVSRVTARRPRGEFDIFPMRSSAPSPSLWLDLAWFCGAERADKLAAAEQGDVDR